MASSRHSVHSSGPALRRSGLIRRTHALIASRKSDRATAPNRRSGDESGAVIILALVFLVAVSLIVTGMLTWVGASLHATGSFQNERDVEYAATDAVNLAIQNTRYTFDYGTTNPNVSPATPMLNNPTPELCATYQVSGQTTSVDVYCSMVWNAYSANTRTFTYSACNTGSPSNAKPADCAAKPLLQAIVAFDDYPSGVATPSPNPTPCTPILPQTPGGLANGSCGVSMTQVSWLWSPTVPAINSLTPASGSTSGGTAVVIQGTGFTSGETVNFTEQPGELAGPQPYNPAVAATVAPPTGSCPVGTCIQVTTPAITVGRAYFVTVTTPGGTSQTAANDYTSPPSFVPTFTYSPGAPSVTGLTGTVAGSITGNTLVTIEGTGFWNAPNNAFPAQAFLCPTGVTPTAGSECSGGLAASVVSITPPPSASTTFTMTAVTPAVSAAGTYYIQVEVFNVYSTQTNVSVPSNLFTYSVQAPLIVSLSPQSGTTGTTLTITGANFLTGSTVGFCPVASYNFTSFACTVTPTAGTVATNPAITATQITVSVPTMTAGNYYPIVTLPSAYNTIPASQPYNEPADIFTHS